MSKLPDHRPHKQCEQEILKAIMNRLKPYSEEIIAEEQEDIRNGRSSAEQILNHHLFHTSNILCQDMAFKRISSIIAYQQRPSLRPYAYHLISQHMFNCKKNVTVRWYLTFFDVCAISTTLSENCPITKTLAKVLTYLNHLCTAGWNKACRRERMWKKNQ